MTTLTIRLATTADAPALRALSALDSAAPLTGPVLVAESAGRAVAALSLDDGRVVADPFEPTRATVAMLRVRAAHLAAPDRRRRWARLGLPARLSTG